MPMTLTTLPMVPPLSWTEHTPRAFSLYGPRWCPVQGGVHSIGYDWRESRSGIRSIAVSTRVPELSGRSFIARTPEDASRDTH